MKCPKPQLPFPEAHKPAAVDIPAIPVLRGRGRKTEVHSNPQLCSLLETSLNYMILSQKSIKGN